MERVIKEIGAKNNPKTNYSFSSRKDKSKSMFFQPKLTIGPVDDAYECEADVVADKVMRMSNNEYVQTKISPVTIQRKCAACEEEEHVQRKEDKSTKEQQAPSIVSDALSSGGSPLDDHSRTFMESRFGYDFSKVKIHTNTIAAKSADSINALAYTSGNNIIFNKGQYSPGTDSGNRLLAHELTHVVQQKASGNLNIQRMAACPAHLDDADPVPPGWRLYPGPTSVFHCGFRTILENRAPTRDDPMNECVYDHAGVLVTDSHPFSGCQGTPDQYDSSAGPLSWLGHGTIDSGGVVRQGVPAFITSRVYDLSVAIASGVRVANTINGMFQSIRQGIGDALVLGIFTARAICSPDNWTFHGIPARSQTHLSVIGYIISSIALSGSLDKLLNSLSRHLNRYPIANLLIEIAADINTALTANGSTVQITATQLGNFSLFQLVEWLNVQGLITYNRPPEQIAPEDMQQFLQAQP